MNLVLLKKFSTSILILIKLWLQKSYFLVIFYDYKIRIDIKEFLKKHKLSNYWDKFDETGNDDLEELATLSERELRGILKNDITMKDGHIRKFLNAVAILKSGGKKESAPGTNESQSVSLTMPMIK